MGVLTSAGVHGCAHVDECACTHMVQDMHAHRAQQACTHARCRGHTPRSTRGLCKDGCTQLIRYTHVLCTHTRGPMTADPGPVQGHPQPFSLPVVTHVSSLDDEVPELPIPQHTEHVLLLALALSHQEVSTAAQ